MLRSHAVLRDCGARRHRDEAARELRRLGRRVPRPRAGHRGQSADALTAREREVAELVATGATNRQIAARLFLSERTVETHLARVFRKLGVTGRGGVAARIVAEKP